MDREYETKLCGTMVRLNILPPNLVKYVSEYIPDIVPFIEKIIKNKYAYDLYSSIYFDSMNILRKQHSDAELQQKEQLGDIVQFSQGSMAALSTQDTNQEKKNSYDFVLWKKSEPGQPSWCSPWSDGQPSSHIGCFILATKFFGLSFAIHTSDIKLKCSHDANIVQSEGYMDLDSWVIYFLHCIHLKIADCKMSNSFKNFETIEQVLEKYDTINLRLLSLLNSWSTSLKYSDHEIKKNDDYKKMIKEFFLNVKTHLHIKNNSSACNTYSEADLKLNETLTTAVKNINLALCNALDTPKAMINMKELILTTSNYIEKKYNLNCQLLINISSYITRLINVFGLNDTPHRH